MSATAAEAPASGQTPPKGKSKKLLIIVAAAVVLLAGGGGGAWWFLQSKKHDESAEAPAEKKPRAAPTYMALESMVANLADPGGERMVQLGITLDVAGDKTAEQIKAMLPVIRSNVLMLITQRTSEELLKRDGKEKLARDIQNEVARALEDAPDVPSHGGSKGEGHKGSGPVNGVLFSSFIVQ